MMGFLPQAVVESRYSENPIHKVYLFLFCEQGRISRVRYVKDIEIEIMVQFPSMKGGTHDLDMHINIPYQ